MNCFHVQLVSRQTRDTIDLTPDRDLSYWDARQILIDLSLTYPVLRRPGAVSFLQIAPVRSAKA